MGQKGVDQTGTKITYEQTTYKLLQVEPFGRYTEVIAFTPSWEWRQRGTLFNSRGVLLDWRRRL